MKKNKHKKWLQFANYVAENWGKCKTRKVGAIIVRENRLLSTGYNGTPKNFKNCTDGGCERCNGNVSSGDNLEICYCVHAEMNAIFNAAYHGISLKDSTLYLNLTPCLTCAKGIINSGIKEVYFIEKYPKFYEEVEEMFDYVGLKIQQYKI